jgi:hypothetical protein
VTVEEDAAENNDPIYGGQERMLKVASVSVKENNNLFDDGGGGREGEKYYGENRKSYFCPR